MKLYTTLDEIYKHRPCGINSKGKSGFSKLLKHLDKTKSDDEKLDLMTVLESNSIQDAIWCLRCFNYRDYCLFCADVAESVLPIFERYNKTDKRPRKAIAAIRDYHANKIIKEQLRAAAAAADDADATYDADAADTAYAAAAAAADAAADADAAYAAYAAAYAGGRKDKWLEIEQLFIKHFG